MADELTAIRNLESRKVEWKGQAIYLLHLARMANRANCIFQDDLNKISHPKCSPENMTLKGHASDVSRFVTKEELMLCDF